jgi:undecaprenyl pyrophosphate phosphatase UppP
MGLGCLLLMNGMVPARSEEWPKWVLFFATAGFAGNFVLILTDHAVNGFFHRSEWIPVISSALAVGSFLGLSPGQSRTAATPGGAWLSWFCRQSWVAPVSFFTYPPTCTALRGTFLATSSAAPHRLLPCCFPISRFSVFWAWPSTINKRKKLVSVRPV